MAHAPVQQEPLLRRLAPIAWHFLRVFLPLAVILTAGSILLYIKDAERITESLKAMEENRMAMERVDVVRDLRDVVSDLVFLRGVFATVKKDALPVIFSENHDESDTSSLHAMLKSFAVVRGRYDQIRFLDINGDERLRVQYDMGAAHIVPEAQLQSKGERYYFKHAVPLRRNELFVSPFDLNVEQGTLELPYKPMLRIVTPVHNAEGARLGFLVLNFEGRRMLNELKRQHVNSPGDLMMLNAQGYWMLAPSPSKEWGFMFENKRSMTFAKEYPALWERLLTGSEVGQFHTHSGITSYGIIHPLSVVEQEARRVMRTARVRALGVGDVPYRWTIISHITPQTLHKEQASSRRLYGMMYGVLMLLVFGGSWIVARATRLSALANTKLSAINRDLNNAVERLERRNRATVRINTMVDFLQACRTEKEIYRIVASNASSLLPGTAGSLNIYDDESSLLECVASWGGDQCSRPLFSREGCWALRRGQVHVVERPGEGPVCPHFANEPETGFICVPLIAHGKVTGLLTSRFAFDTTSMEPERLHRYATGMEQHLVAISEHVALTLSNLRLRESLREQSIRDQLTGLYNRRHMEESLAREFSRAQRHEQPLSVIMLDVDHFKNFNDTYGHELGDEVLRKLGETLRLFSRHEDIACRFGGEEFVLILPGAAADDARRRAEELRTTVAERMAVRHGEEKLTVTISLGVSEYPAYATSTETLIATSDAALYAAKEGGRNQVQLAKPVTAVANGEGGRTQRAAQDGAAPDSGDNADRTPPDSAASEDMSEEDSKEGNDAPEGERGES